MDWSNVISSLTMKKLDIDEVQNSKKNEPQW